MLIKQIEIEMTNVKNYKLISLSLNLNFWIEISKWLNLKFWAACSVEYFRCSYIPLNLYLYVSPEIMIMIIYYLIPFYSFTIIIDYYIFLHIEINIKNKKLKFFTICQFLLVRLHLPMPKHMSFRHFHWNRITEEILLQIH